MQKLEPPDAHHLRAAEGWQELGLPAESAAELDLISPAQQQHPDVLETRWVLLARAGRWVESLVVARQLHEAAPKRASAWLHLAYSTRRAKGGGLQQAWDVLFQAVQKFSNEPTVCFNLACYSCQLGNLDEARGWVKRALKIGDHEKIKLMALADDDLKPLWKEIRKL